MKPPVRVGVRAASVSERDPGTHYGRMPKDVSVETEDDPRKPEDVKQIECDINALYARVMRNPLKAIDDGLIPPIDERTVMRPATSPDQLHINPTERLYLDACILKVLGSQHPWIIQVVEVIGDLSVKIIGRKF